MFKPVTQSRAGKDGTCFRSCIASCFGLDEEDVPDWPRTNLDHGVTPWLQANYGLRYVERPYNPANPPEGLHILCGTSPRGGQHAVVGKDGLFLWDPHPQDGTGRWLVDVSHYGEFLPAKSGLEKLPVRRPS
jgi:hypothetical protein